MCRQERRCSTTGSISNLYLVAGRHCAEDVYLNGCPAIAGIDLIYSCHETATNRLLRTPGDRHPYP